jgi:hypothetical protein
MNNQKENSLHNLASHLTYESTNNLTKSLSDLASHITQASTQSSQESSPVSLDP